MPFEGNMIGFHDATWQNDKSFDNAESYKWCGSHGCINLSPSNAKWFFDNFGSGDPIVVKNSVGTYNKPDGASDWQM